jgi:hypothetical protein
MLTLFQKMDAEMEKMVTETDKGKESKAKEIVVGTSPLLPNLLFPQPLQK